MKWYLRILLLLYLKIKRNKEENLPYDQTYFIKKIESINQIREENSEYVRFIIGRVITYLINLGLLVIAVEWLGLDKFWSNVVITIIVIILKNESKYPKFKKVESFEMPKINIRNTFFFSN